VVLFYYLTNRVGEFFLGRKIKYLAATAIESNITPTLHYHEVK
jgi:hypothetical protein